MGVNYYLTIATLLCCSIHYTSAADCDKTQRRQPGDPLGTQIANALQKNNALDSVCSNSWADSPKIKTYNEGNIIYNVTRSNSNDAPNDNACISGFKDIISQCISSGDYWGGKYIYNAFTYAIYNSVYPSNGLPSYDATSAVGSTAAATHAVNTHTGEGGPTGTPAAGTPQPTPTPTKHRSSSKGAGNEPSSTAAVIPGQTVITETDSDGSAIVGTFVPTTLSKYTTLKSQTTITTTTTRDGVPIVFPLVIGAGGVAWAIIGGAPPAGITPPGEPPESDEDPSDQNTQHTAPKTTFHRTKATTLPSSAIISSSAAASSTTGVSIITAIDDTPFPNIAAIQAAFVTPQGPLPDSDDASSSLPHPSKPLSTKAASTKQTATPTGAHPPGSTQYGPSQYCQGLSPGSGGETCTPVPAGCYIVIPAYNIIPQPVCPSSTTVDGLTTTAPPQQLPTTNAIRTTTTALHSASATD
ncbi:MAG: hypothetical protein Q9218_004873, partial [Villophora microphyllina]